MKETFTSTQRASEAILMLIACSIVSFFLTVIAVTFIGASFGPIGGYLTIIVISILIGFLCGNFARNYNVAVYFIFYLFVLASTGLGVYISESLCYYDPILYLADISTVISIDVTTDWFWIIVSAFFITFSWFMVLIPKRKK